MIESNRRRMGPEYHQIENDALSSSFFNINETADEDQHLSISSDEIVDLDNEKGKTDDDYFESSGELSDFEGSEAVDVFVFLSCNYLFINQYDCSYIGS